MSTIHFQHYSSVHISLSVILKIFPQKVSTRRSSRTFPSESFPQKVPLRRFLQVRFFFFQKVAYRRSPSQVSLRRFSLESSSWKLPLQFLQKFPLVVSIRSFPKMFPLKGSLQKFSLRRFPQKLPLEGYCWRLPLGMLLSEGFPQRDSLESFPSAVVQRYLAFLYIAHSITSGLKP